jgi:amidase
MSEEGLQRSAMDQAALVRAGEMSARELVEASLEAIDRRNGELNAFVTLASDRALAEADAIDAGDERPLAGVPIAIKDIVALTEGIRTTFGTAAVGDWVPPLDSAVVRRLRSAGAVVVGKTNTPELGILPVTEPHRFGPTRNPWDTARTPGGSSGGSAAAVAAGMVSLAHGNDGGGSLRIPAACCGLVGHKPSRGRVSTAPGPGDVMGLVAEGVLTRTVADTAIALDLLSGYEPGDPFLAPAPAMPFGGAAQRDPRRLRIGFVTEAPMDFPLDPEHAEGVTEAAKLLESLGHDVEEVGLPIDDPATFLAHFLRVWVADVAGSVKTLGSVVGGELDRDRLEPLTRQMVETGEATTAVDYVASVAYLRVASRGILGFWTDHDVLLSPTLAQPPLEIGALEPGEGEEAMAMLGKSAGFVPFAAPINVTGQPAVSLPLHQSADGLPVGVHLIGPPGDDELLISLAGQLERARPWSERRPALTAAA